MKNTEKLQYTTIDRHNPLTQEMWDRYLTEVDRITSNGDGFTMFISASYKPIIPTNLLSCFSFYKNTKTRNAAIGQLFRR